jgi:hypothetical protein
MKIISHLKPTNTNLKTYQLEKMHAYSELIEINFYLPLLYLLCKCVHSVCSPKDSVSVCTKRGAGEKLSTQPFYKNKKHF